MAYVQCCINLSTISDDSILSGRASKGSRRPVPTDWEKYNGSASLPTVLCWVSLFVEDIVRRLLVRRLEDPVDVTVAFLRSGSVLAADVVGLRSTIGSLSSKSHSSKLAKWRRQLLHNGRCSIVRKLNQCSIESTSSIETQITHHHTTMRRQRVSPRKASHILSELNECVP